MATTHDASSSQHPEYDGSGGNNQELQKRPDKDSSNLDRTSHRFKRATPQSRAHIAAQLEGMVRNVEEAMHVNNFDPSTPPWSEHFHPVFSAEVGLLANSHSKRKVSVGDFCKYMKARKDANPEYQVNITGMTTNVNTRRGKADIFCNMEQVGLPVGIVRPSVTFMVFECVDGRWVFVRWGSFRGVGGYE